MSVPAEQLYQIITAAAVHARLPWWLIYTQIERESDFDPKAQSACGAIGLMQIMPQTARDCGADPGTLWDPAENVRLGARILAERVAVFRKEDPDNALKFGLAAYNGGLAPVINAQALAFRHGLDPSQWDSVRKMLPESWVYVGGEWKKPDFEQIIGYVDWIWAKYQERKDKPVPTVGAAA